MNNPQPAAVFVEVFLCWLMQNQTRVGKAGLTDSRLGLVTLSLKNQKSDLLDLNFLNRHQIYSGEYKTVNGLFLIRKCNIGYILLSFQ